VHGGVGIGQSLVVGGEQVAALGGGYDLREGPPRLREQRAQAVEKPLDLAPAAQEHAAQYEARTTLGVRFAIGQRKRAAPRAAEHEPALDPEMLAQPLDVGHEMQCGVVAQLPQRRRASRSALVEDDDPVMHGIEETPVRG